MFISKTVKIVFKYYGTTVDKSFIGWILRMTMCFLLCYPVSFHMLQLPLTGGSYFWLNVSFTRTSYRNAK